MEQVSKKRKTPPTSSEMLLEEGASFFDSKSQQESKENQVPSLENYLKKRMKKNTEGNNQNNQPNINIALSKKKDVVKIDRGFVNLPREVVIEALLVKNHIEFKSALSSGRNEYYYACNISTCQYKLKIIEKEEEIKKLSTVNLVKNFKDFDLTKSSELKEGISHLTEMGEHSHLEDSVAQNKKKLGKIFTSFKNFLIC